MKGNFSPFMSQNNPLEQRVVIFESFLQCGIRTLAFMMISCLLQSAVSFVFSYTTAKGRARAFFKYC